MNTLISANINIVPTLPIKGIYYIGQYGTSGYASAARGYLFHYFSNGFPITWDPLYFDDSKLNDDNVYDITVQSLIRRPISAYDTVIMHSTPDLWPKFWQENPNTFKNKIVVGYCTWEASKLPEQWVNCINQSCYEVWCPSVYNETVFKNSGVTVAVRVVPHIFLPQILPNKETVKIFDINNKCYIENTNSIYTFYTIGEMNSRKGIEDVITTFCTSFTKKDPVRLIIKTHYKNYFEENKLKCKNIIDKLLSSYPNHPQVICLLDNMSNKEILALHSLGDCYISLTKSEGFGLTIFDAFNYGKKVIVTGYGGHLDYLGATHTGLIKYELGPVNGMDGFSDNYKTDQLWAYPNLEHARELIKNI